MKKDNKQDPNFSLGMFFEMYKEVLQNPDMFSIFGLPREQKERYPHERLGNGYELRKIELKNKKGEPLENTSNYSNLYLNGEKLSDLIFRKGGLGGDFKDGYVSLIHYVYEKDPKKSNENGLSFGDHVIVNEKGQICLTGKSLDCPHHIGGHLGSIKDYIYDLRTGKCIAPKSSTTISGKNCIIVQHQYDWYNKEIVLPLGIYRIDFETAKVTKIDDVRK